MKQVELTPIKNQPSYWDEMEAHIIEVLKEAIYLPLVKDLGLKKKTLKNAMDELLDAIKYGRISFERGKFTGRFNASVSKELKALGAKWNRREGSWEILSSSLPMEVKFAISASHERFTQTLSRIDRTLSRLVPEEIADKLKIENIFDSTLFKVDKDFKKTLKNITIVPDLPPERRKQIAKEWSDNMKLDIKNWTEKAIKDLRKDVQKVVFTGNRHETMVKTIQASYGVSQNKAKFLARQETNLLMAKYNKSRYLDAGIKKYKWGTVAGSALHPVRPMHKALEGKVFFFDDPPVTNEKGDRNNPQEDYNCRCFARPIVEF